MFRIRILFALLLTAAVALTPAHLKAQNDSADGRAIQKVLEDQAAAWNRGDVDTFMTGYDNSPETTFVGVKVERGYALILDRYKKSYSNAAQMGQLSFVNLDVRMLGSQYAVVTGNFHLERTKDGGGEAKGIFSLIFAKRKAGWKIILDHTSAN
ncbi:MAG TPA: nuclear transport factor 2 family protein [Acidobacteriaceae bacterium]|nr:nuclear transport factor 2 family protein [Acidobacteriaceae bacterium]